MRCIPHSLLECSHGGAEPWVSTVVNCLLTHPLLISSFPFLTSAHTYNVSGVNPAILLSESNWNMEPRGCSRLELMFSFLYHTPGVREPKIPYSEGLEALPRPVQVTLSLGSDFRRADYTIIHTSRPKIWMSLDKQTDCPFTCTYALVKKESGRREKE